MQRAEGLVLTSLRSDSTPAPAVSQWTAVGRGVLVGVVFLYLGSILLGPLAALLIETKNVGFGVVFASLWTVEACRALGMTVILTAIAVVINAVVGVLGALAIVRHRFQGRMLLGFLFDLPLAVSPVMIGLSFLLLVGRDGVLSPLLNAIDFQVVFSFPGLVIATLFVTLPYTLREVAYVLEEIGSSEEEAATTLGASPLQTFFRVTLSNIRGALSYGIMMTVARALGEFGAVLVLGGSISGQTQTATTFIHDAMEERQVDSAYGMALVLAALSGGLLLVLERTKFRAPMVVERFPQ